MGPFDYINAASYNKKDLMTGTENDKLAENGYDPYLTNKAFANFADTILHANEMNALWHLDNKSQFQYYINILRPRKRFKKWLKKEKDNNIELICNAYQCNKRVAKQYLNILSDEQLTLLKKEQETGGV
jgi:hypothetical protein